MTLVTIFILGGVSITVAEYHGQKKLGRKGFTSTYMCLSQSIMKQSEGWN